MSEELQEAIEFMQELSEDSNVSRNIKLKIGLIAKSLQDAKKEELSLTINKLLSDLDEISSDANLDQFTRQQIWSISSMLEGLNG